MVGRARSCLRGPRHLHRIRHSPRLRRRFLLLGPLSFAFLFAADRPPASLVAFFAGALDLGWPPRLSHHLLLLSQGLLSRFLLGPAGLRRRRVSPQLQG